MLSEAGAGGLPRKDGIQYSSVALLIVSKGMFQRGPRPSHGHSGQSAVGLSFQSGVRRSSQAMTPSMASERPIRW